MAKKDEKQIKAENKMISLIAEVVPTHNEDGSKMKLEQRIRYAATAKLTGKYNLVQNKAAKESFLRHQEICKGLVELSEEFGVPCCYVMYFSDKTAHKTEVFNKGYKKFDKEKSIAIIKMAQAYAKWCLLKTPSDGILHAFCTYYEQGNTDPDKFINEVLPTIAKSSTIGCPQVCTILGIKCRSNK